MNIFQKFLANVNDQSKTLQERLFYLLTTAGLGVLAAVLVVGLLVGESSPALGVMAVGWVCFFFLRKRAIRTGHYKTGIHVIATIFVFFVLPIGFFGGGGLQGGSAMWFIFGFVYIALMVPGKARWIFWAANLLLTTGCYVVSYFYPQLITSHNYQVAHIDSYASVLILSFTICFMIMFQNKVYIEENKKTDQQKQEIMDLNRSQNRFFSTMSHEIRTPINTIIGLNEMTLRRDDIPDEVAESATHIQGASKVLLSLINDILDMSKIESGKMNIVRAPYSMADMISEVVGMMSIRAKEKDLIFKVDVDESLPSRLVGDEVRIKQILINLLTNAIKYTETGTITMAIQLVSTERDIASVAFTVSDTGMGIKKESIPYLFNAFKRIDEEKNSNIEGSGLGLSIVKQLVDLMDGDINVNSIYSKGSSFMVTLPQQISDASPVGKISLGIKAGGNIRQKYQKRFEASGAKILIVDDNELNLMVEEKLLRDTKAIIDTVSSGKDAISKCLQTRYDIIFMDHLMPGIDGIEALHGIRTQIGGQNRGTPIIALTANADNVELYRREGFDDQLIKPVSGADMESALLTYLPKTQIQFIGENVYTENRESAIMVSKRKKLVIVTSESVCDLPEHIIKEKKIPIISNRIMTDNGEFTDGMEIVTEGVLEYISDRSRIAMGRAPTIAEYENFFAQRLELSQFVIHITASKKMSDAFGNAMAASGTYDNVVVIDSEFISCGMGMLVLAAHDMAEQGMDTASIIKGINQIKSRISTSFNLDTLFYLSRNGRVPPRAKILSEAFMLHPIVELRGGIMRPRTMKIGKLEDIRKLYIRQCFRHARNIDRRVLFIPYSGLTFDELKEIERNIREYIVFDEVILQKVSCTSATIFGGGTFGLVYQVKEEQVA